MIFFSQKKMNKWLKYIYKYRYMKEAGNFYVSRPTSIDYFIHLEIAFKMNKEHITVRPDKVIISNRFYVPVLVDVAKVAK